MALASEILARAYEDSNGPYPELDNRDVVAQFQTLDEELSLLLTLRGLNSADKALAEGQSVILIFSGLHELETVAYRDSTGALNAIYELEKQYPDRDVVLVKAHTSAEVRLAFKNYFSDAKDFIQFVEDGCTILSHVP